MTSPDKSVPSGSYTGPGGSGGGLPSLQKLTWESARQSIVSSVLQSFSGVGTATTNLNNATSQAMTVATTAQAGAIGAQSTATSAQTSSTANASAIAALQTQQQQSQVGGASVTDNFQSWSTADWTTVKTGPVADMTVVNGEAGIGKQGDTGSGNVVALWNTPLMTDAEMASVVLGNANQASNIYGSGPIIRAATDLSSFVFASVSTGGLILGHGTRSSGTTTFSQWVAQTGVTIGTGDTVTLAANGTTYTVSVNGVGLLSYSDAAAVVPVAATNRSVGFVSAYVQQSSAWGTSSYFGFDLASFTAADTISPSVVGTGWSVYRQATSSVSQASTGAGASRLSAGTLDTVRSCTNGVNVVDLGTGAIQVAKSGWYVISLGLQWDTAAGSNPYWAGVYTAPSATGPWTFQRAGGETAGSAIYSTTNTFVLFLAAGSLVAPGYLTVNSAGVRGDANGLATFFDGTLCSFS